MLFARYPAEWKKVIADPATIPNAVEEILRFWAPTQYQGRYSLRESEWHGVTIPADEPVFLLTGSANRDERAYDNADAFDIDREIGLSVGFGHGIHVCLGAALARLEMRVGLEEFLARHPGYEIDERALERVHSGNVRGYSRMPVRL